MPSGQVEDLPYSSRVGHFAFWDTKAGRAGLLMATPASRRPAGPAPVLGRHEFSSHSALDGTRRRSLTSGDGCQRLLRDGHDREGPTRRRRAAAALAWL